MCLDQTVERKLVLVAQEESYIFFLCVLKTAESHVDSGMDFSGL